MQALPRAPRSCRRGAALATWRGFGVAACIVLLMVLLAGVALLAADDFRLPRADWLLDTATRLDAAPGVVVDVRIERDGHLNVTGYDYTYAFTAPDGIRRQDHCWSKAQQLAIGAQVQVEFADGAPQLSRIAGMHRARSATWWPVWATAALAAMCGIGLWLARAYRTWVIARHGRAAPVRLVALRPARRRGRSLHVRYAFADGSGGEREATQHVWQRTSLGLALLATAPGAPIEHALVVHDENNPRRCRLLSTTDVAEADA
jgi:hypothetical protein